MGLAATDESIFLLQKNLFPYLIPLRGESSLCSNCGGLVRAVELVAGSEPAPKVCVK